MLGSFKGRKKRGMSLLGREAQERKSRWSESPLPVLPGTIDSRDKKVEIDMKRTLTKMRSKCPHCFAENLHGIAQDKSGRIFVQCSVCKDKYEVKK